MEELKSTKVDWKKIVVVGMLVVLTGLVSAGVTWYVMDMGREAELDVKDDEIATLEIRVSELEAELSDRENPENATEETTQTTPVIDNTGTTGTPTTDPTIETGPTIDTETN